MTDGRSSQMNYDEELVYYCQLFTPYTHRDMLLFLTTVSYKPKSSILLYNTQYFISVIMTGF